MHFLTRNLNVFLFEFRVTVIKYIGSWVYINTHAKFRDDSDPGRAPKLTMATRSTQMNSINAPECTNVTLNCRYTKIVYYITPRSVLPRYSFSSAVLSTTVVHCTIVVRYGY